MAIPRSNETYKSKEYWDERFANELHYEWLETFSTLKEHIITLLNPNHSILVIGCGNSNLSSDMYDAGFHNITSLDYSQVVISNLEKCHSSSRPEMQWVCADMRELEMAFPKEMEEEHGFDLIIDKAGMDALLTDEKNPWDPNQRTIEDCHRVLGGVSSLLKHGGYFIQVTFSQPHFHRRYIEGPSVDFDVNFNTVGDVMSTEYQWKGTVKELHDQLKFSNYLWIMKKYSNLEKR